MLALVVLILVALAFDFMNGFHDAANSIAPVVSTRVLTPRAAVAWAAFFNFVAAFGFGVAVATTVGKGIVKPEVVDNGVIFAGVSAAFVWDWITWRYGLPSSSSHALIAGLAGAGAAKGGGGGGGRGARGGGPPTSFPSPPSPPPWGAPPPALFSWPPPQTPPPG